MENLMNNQLFIEELKWLSHTQHNPVTTSSQALFKSYGLGPPPHLFRQETHVTYE